MRVISQNGMSDFPYENTSLHIKSRPTGGGKYVYDVYINTDADWDWNRVVATYRTEEKAKQTLEKLRRLYMDTKCLNNYIYDYPKVFRLPSDEDADSE